MNLLRMSAVPILEQLYLEERLLRTSVDNWCIVNDRTSRPTIVMGISGFTGGGTVIVDDGTVFVSFICNKNAIPGLQPYPHPIMSWTGQLYSEVLQGFGDFHLRENDYAFNSHKFGGNAQSIIKERWIHHTSFLWDYDIKNMEYLKHPTRAPKYRSARPHVDFLCRMKDYVPSKSTFIERTIKSVGNYFLVKPFGLDDITTEPSCTLPHSTKLLTRQELEDAYSSQSAQQSSENYGHQHTLPQLRSSCLPDEKKKIVCHPTKQLLEKETAGSMIVSDSSGAVVCSF
ncbi:hypothetical protein OPV22_026768 [Ensete ventricosum]|uniref:BPL/LPL catalytic domain-containing protein n=1 Tax=Ensete ventricosum TaxID=4639 RepID=A0AAV8PVQ2_ENSVE|nr:hypothetical protein OPV22_026768 [Ensete ventricosum]